jgi:hypothetical protein
LPLFAFASWSLSFWVLLITELLREVATVAYVLICVVLELKLNQGGSTILHTLMGRGFLALGCKCSLYIKCNLNIFWIVKKILKKCCMYIFTIYAWDKLFHENPTLPVGLGKKDKNSMVKLGFARDFFCLFNSQHYKYRFTTKLSHAYVVCQDVHTKFFFGIFWHFQMYFLNKGSIYTLDQICISRVANENCVKFCMKEVFKCRERRMTRWDEVWIKAQDWVCPCHPKNYPRSTSVKAWGCPKAPSSSSIKISGHLSRHYIFIASYAMCFSWSVFIFAFSFLLFCLLQ